MFWIKNIFGKSKTQKLPPNTIVVDRDSVSMGDDYNGHRMSWQYGEDEMLSSVLSCLKSYIPAMPQTVWAIHVGENVVGYYVCGDKDNNEEWHIELVGPDIKVSQLPEKSLFCKYFYKGAEAYFKELPDEMPLIEKVKKFYARKEED